MSDYYLKNSPTKGNELSPSCQAAMVAAAMFSTDHKNNSVRNVNNYNYSKTKSTSSTNKNINYKINNNTQQRPRNVSPKSIYRINQQHQQLQKPLFNQPQHVMPTSSNQMNSRKTNGQVSINLEAKPLDKVSLSPSSTYKSPPHLPTRNISDPSLNSEIPKRHTSQIASTLVHPSDSISIASNSSHYNQHSSWNDANINSSSTALAAAASIAKNNPNSLISTSTSPKLVRRKVPSNTKQTITRSTLRRPTSENHNFMNAMKPISSILRDDTESIDNCTNLSPSKNKPGRKPPPPPRTSISESVSNTANIIPPPQSSEISFEHNSDNTSFQFPIQHNNNVARSSISISHPDLKLLNSSSSIHSNSNNFYKNTTDSQYFHNQDTHKRSISRSKKLSNFFSTNPTKEDFQNQRLYNLQASNSTSMLPSHLQQLNFKDSNSFNPEVSIQPLSAPSISTQGDYFTQPHDELYNDKGLYNNNNGSTGNIYQQGPSVSSSHQLVFRTTLRNSDKRSGFGRSRKSKAEFNEDKPWKNHERANLNIVSSEERKRYEGVFAANKGVYIDLDLRLNEDSNKSELLKPVKILRAPSDNSVINESERLLSDFVNTYSPINDRIHGLVVREIWIRSKLDHDTLKKMWSLVLDDRKRRWLKLISNGDTQWLPDDNDDISEFGDPGITGDNNVDDMSTVNDLTLRNGKDDVRQLNRNDDTLNDEISDREDTDVDSVISDPAFDLDEETEEEKEEEENKDEHDDHYEEAKDGEEEHHDDNEDESVNDANDGKCDNRSIRAKSIMSKANPNNSVIDEDTDIDADIDENANMSKDITEFADEGALNGSTPTLNGATVDRVATDENKMTIDPPQTPQSQQLIQKKTLESNENTSLLEIDRNLFDDGTLTIDEFIVGMWLVDQCLYGRKIPKVVPLSVWETIGVDWTVSGGVYGGPYQHHTHAPVISGVSDIVGMGIKKGKKAGTRKVLKKVIGM